MHRFRRVLVAFAVTLSLVAGTATAMAHTGSAQPDAATQFTDDWTDDEFGDGWDDWTDDEFDNWLDDELDDSWFDDELGDWDDWTDDGFDDSWFDDDFGDWDDWTDDEFDGTTDDWDDDGFDDSWLDDDVGPETITTLIQALDECLDAEGGIVCVLDAIDAVLWPTSDSDGFDEWGDGQFDEPWSDDLFGDEYPSDPGSSFDDQWFEGGLDPVDDPETEAAIEARFEELIPEEWRRQVTDISLETDGPGGVVAAVEPLTDTLDQWALYVDPADRSFELDHTLIHEFAHVMTLNDSQLDAQLVYSDQDLSDAAAACATYFTGEGCAKPDSYMAQFVDAFWDPILEEFRQIETISDDLAWEDAMFDFYDRYADQFVSDYAATNPGEDISESFTAYVMAPELPDGDTIAEQKILFFDRFEELAELRDSIRARL